jgi:serine/threonine protein kinase
MSAAPDKLSTRDWQQIRRLVALLERALQKADAVALEALGLPPPGDRLRRPALRELIKTDLDIQWGRGRQAHLEDYLAELPELKDDRELCLELLHAEYGVRQQHGHPPRLQSFQERFPALFPRLQRLLEGHAAPSAKPASRPAQSAPPPLAPNPDGQVLPVTGGYKLLSRLGSGTFGEVWRAEAPGGVPVALKIIFRPLGDEDARRELESLELLKRLRHPFLVPIHQFFPLEDRLLIVMNLADGSLRDRHKACRKAGLPGIPVAELLGYLGQAADALDYLHREQVLHRDIKPDNILLLKGYAQLADFGLARTLEMTGSQQGTTSGTPAYMAPEVWRGRISEHSDQYALAASYVELRLGRPVFQGTNLVQLMLDHAEHSPNLDPLPAAEQEVLQRALAKDPQQRYANCREFHRALAGAVAAPVGPFSRPDTEPDVEAGPPPSGYRPVGEEPTARPTPRSLDRATVGSQATPVLPVAPAPGWRYWPLVAGLLALALLVVAGWAFRHQLARIGGAGNVSEEGEGTTTPAVSVYMPEHCQPDASGPEPRTGTLVVGSRKLHEQIAYVLRDKTPVVFVLIPPDESRKLPAFYLMRDKVTYGLFEKFVTANPQAVVGDEWRKGTVLADGTIKKPENDFPVFRVTAGEAARCARWLGGELPTARQWDKASGKYEAEAEQRVGPFLVPWNPQVPGQIAVGRKDLGPAPAGSSPRDRSVFGCRDMAGNGYEWTRTVALRDDTRLDQLVPPDNQDGGLPVWLRGQTFRALSPAHFTDDPESELFGKRKDENGFRVVIELPPAAGS